MAPYERERDVDLSPWDMGKAVVRRLSGAQKAALNRDLARSNHVRIKQVGKKAVPEADPGFEDDILWALHGLKEAPFKIERKAIEDLDAELVEHISREAQALNSYFFLNPLPADEDGQEESGSTDSSMQLNARVTTQR